MLRFTRRREPTPTPDPFDRRGYVRSPVTLPAYRLGKPSPYKGVTFPPEVPTSEEVFRLMAACDRGRNAGARNRAMIAVGARAGLREGEMLALYPKDVDLERGRINVLRGKGGKHRLVDFDPGACAIVKQWVAQRQELGFAGRHPLFCVINGPSRGEAINAPYVRELMKKLATAAGIEKRVYYHGLRHHYASVLLDKGVPMHVIKKMLGHSSVVITEHYADHIGNETALAMVRAIAWSDHGVTPAPGQRRPWPPQHPLAAAEPTPIWLES